MIPCTIIQFHFILYVDRPHRIELDALRGDKSRALVCYQNGATIDREHITESTCVELYRSATNHSMPVITLPANDDFTESVGNSLNFTQGNIKSIAGI